MDDRAEIARALEQCIASATDDESRFDGISQLIGDRLGLTSAASMGDLAAIALFGNQDLTNLTLLLYNQISAYRIDSASGTALVLLALCLATFALIERGIGGRRRSLVLS